MIGLKSTLLNIFLAMVLLAGLLSACENSEPLPVPQEKPQTSVPANTSKPKPDEEKNPAIESTEPASQVKIVYFHPKRRCGPCISIETRTREILEENFQDAMDSDKITFQSYELEDPQNAEMVDKYGAVGSQLFINIVKNGSENIK